MQLFDVLESRAKEILMMNDGKVKHVTLKTKLNMEEIEWDKDYRIVKSSGMTITEVFDQPGAAPAFVFMPTKVQLMKMILNAAYYYKTAEQH